MAARTAPAAQSGAGKRRAPRLCAVDGHENVGQAAEGMLLESLGELFDHAPEKAQGFLPRASMFQVLSCELKRGCHLLRKAGVLAFDAGATRTYNELLASSWAAGREKLPPSSFQSPLEP